MESYIWPLGCRNKSATVDRVPCPGGNDRGCPNELGESGGWVVGVTLRASDRVEGGTLVFGQWDTVLDPQWQVGLESKESQDSAYH